MAWRDELHWRIGFWFCHLPCLENLEIREYEGDTVGSQPHQELIGPWNCGSHDGYIDSDPRETMSEKLLQIPICRPTHWLRIARMAPTPRNSH